MNMLHWVKGTVVTVTLLSFCTLSAAYGNKSKEKEAVAPAQEHMMPSGEEMMAKMMEYATPNENHEVLATLVGEWEHTIKMWKSPDAEPEISTGTTESDWILGGRFVQQTVSGSWNGQPFEGIGITGFDNVRKEYTSVWLDNMGTGIMSSKGDFDAENNTLAEHGSFSCPFMGPDAKFRGAIKINDDDSYVYEMFMTGPDGSEMKTMEITYNRKS